MTWNFDRSNVGKRHACIFRLPACVPARQMRVTKNARRRMAKHLLRHPRVGIRVLTKREHLLFAKETFAAGDREGNDDAIANRQIRHLTTDLDDLAHKLMTKNVARDHRGNEAIIQVKVGTTDRGGRDLYDGVALID